MKVQTIDCVVEYEENKDECYQALLEFFVKHEAFCGETIMQSDGPQLEAPELLADIADKLFKFKVEWK